MGGVAREAEAPRGGAPTPPGREGRGRRTAGPRDEGWTTPGSRPPSPATPPPGEAAPPRRPGGPGGPNPPAAFRPPALPPPPASKARPPLGSARFFARFHPARGEKRRGLLRPATTLPGLNHPPAAFWAPGLPPSSPPSRRPRAPPAPGPSP